MNGGRAPIAVTPYGRSGASSRVRVYDWLDHLATSTRIVGYAGTRNNRPSTLLRSLPRVLQAEAMLRTPALARDRTLLLHREASPFSDGRLEVALMRRAERSVYDFDDALQWDVGGSGLRRRFAKSRKCLAAVRTADTVIAGNDVLADWAREWCSNVVVVPSCIEPDDYLVKTCYRISGPPRLVWIGSPSTEGQLCVAADALLEVRRRTGATLVVVSAGAASLGSLDEMTERVRWNPAEAARQAVAADIGIAPLIDGAYERGKCAYKILQYAAAGLPVVGTPVGANRSVLATVGGTAAESTDAWVNGLMAWITATDEARVRVGRHARREVCDHYSFAAWSDTWRSYVGL